MRTDELSGLELRKRLCEKLGYRVEKTTAITGDDMIADGYTLLKARHNKVTGRWLPSEEWAWKDCPALESDPGVFWPEFEKWAFDNYVGWSVKTLSNRFKVFETWSGGRFFGAQMSESITEAGCRAWLAALEGLEK